jgi:hypothetical protein
MRQDFFEYTPQFKLLIAGNHKPSFRSVDEAIRRRLHLIPFTITIPLAERDVELLDKLKNELPGILAWMIRGASTGRNRALRRRKGCSPRPRPISNPKTLTPPGRLNAASEIPTHGKAPPTSSPAGQRGLKKPARTSVLKGDSLSGLKRAE